MSRVFFATDVHGSEAVFRKILNTVHTPLNPDLIIIGGDITGKLLVPIIHKSGSWSAKIYPHRRTASNTVELEALIRWVADRGAYGVVTTVDKWRQLVGDENKSDAVLRTERLKRLRAWLTLAESKTHATGCRVMMNTGNDDPFYVDDAFDKQSHCGPLENRIVEIDDNIQIISCGYTNPTPWSCPRDIGDGELRSMLEAKIGELANPRRAIFNFHCPPISTGLDEAMLLDEQLRPRISFGGPVFGPVGSKAVRSTIEKWQPLLGLHGHIHEAFGHAYLGQTICCNPGSDYQNGTLRGVFFVTDRNGLAEWALFKEGDF